MDSWRAEYGVPGVRACEIRPERQVLERLLIVVEDRTNFINVRKTIVIFCTQSKTLEGSESRYADRIEVISS